MCNCEFDTDPQSEDERTPETAWHYLRTCTNCGGQWYGLHCPHEGRQNACPHWALFLLLFQILMIKI